MIPFTCPCGQTLDAGDAQGGRMTRCPECGRELAVPGGTGVQTADAPRAPAVPRDEGVQTGPGRPSRALWEDWPQPPPISGLAVGSLVLGVLSLFCTLLLIGDGRPEGSAAQLRVQFLDCALLPGLPAIVLGALALWDVGRSQGRKKGKGLAITGVIAGIVLPLLLTTLWLPTLQKLAEGSSIKQEAANDLKQIDLAMQDYHEAFGTFPAAAICDPNGKPLLSWRVAILPYLEQGYLYNRFQLEEPWDGPNNSKLLSSMPKVYAMPSDKKTPAGYTCYRVFVGNGAAFDPPSPAKVFLGFLRTKGVSKDDFPDGTVNTILVVEAATDVPWTKPDELAYDPNGPLPPLGGHFRAGFMAALANGAVKLIPANTSPQTLRAAITRNGGETLPPDW